MANARSFSVQLESFRQESSVAAQYLYAEMAVQHAASLSEKLLARLNLTPQFWLVHLAATQTACYIAVGRIFDTRSPFNVDELINAFERDIDQFSRQALEARKSEGASSRPSWLDEYLEQAHYPDSRDVARLRRHVARHREFYKRAVKPVRHKVLAHREKHNHQDVQALYGQGKLREMWRTVTFLLALHDALWEQFHNGRKPVLKPTRFSVKQMYRGNNGRTGPHEIIVRETKTLMEFLAK